MRRNRTISIVTCLVLACSTIGLPVAGQSPAPSFDPATLVPELADLTPEDLAAMGDEVLSADLERFGVTAFDADLPGILSELRAIAGDELAGILADQEQPRVPGLEGTTGLVASIAAPGPPHARRTHDQGGALLMVLGNMVVEVGDFIENVRPGPGASVIEPTPYQKSSTTTVGGRDVGTQQKIVVRQAVDHSTVSLSRAVSATYVIPGPDGQLKATVEDSATVRVRIDVCPDDQGVVKGRIDTLGEVKFAGTSGPDYHAMFLGSDDLSAQVTDQATVGPVQHAQEARRQATGHRPAFGNEPAKDTNATVVVRSTHASSPGSPPADSYTVSQEQGADMADHRIAAFVTGLTRSVADEALAAASAVWKNGRCLKVVATPGTSTVYPGSSTPIEVTIRHIVDESDVQRKVSSTLRGPVSVSPTDPIDAPGTVTFLAPNEEANSTIAFRTVSDRGIAETRETYTVDPEACPPPAGVRRPGLPNVASLRGGRLVAQAEDEDCPRTLVLSGTITGSYTSEFNSSIEQTQASIEVTLTLTYDDRWGDYTTSGTATLDSEITGDCHFSFHESGPFEYAYADATSGVPSGNMFVGVHPEWGLAPEERHLEAFPLYVAISGTGEATCGHETGDVLPWQAGVGTFSACEELLVTNLGDRSWHGECQEDVGDRSEVSWVVNLAQE